MPGRQVMTAKASTKFQRKMRVRSKSPVNQVQNQNSHIHTRNVVPCLQKMDKRKIKFYDQKFDLKSLGKAYNFENWKFLLLISGCEGQIRVAYSLQKYRIYWNRGRPCII